MSQPKWLTPAEMLAWRQFSALFYAIKFAVELLIFAARGALRVNARYFFNCFTFDAIDSAL